MLAVWEEPAEAVVRSAAMAGQVGLVVSRARLEPTRSLLAALVELGESPLREMAGQVGLEAA